jgi:hypothetical protein
VRQRTGDAGDLPVGCCKGRPRGMPPPVRGDAVEPGPGAGAAPAFKRPALGLLTHTHRADLGCVAPDHPTAWIHRVTHGAEIRHEEPFWD